MLYNFEPASSPHAGGRVDPVSGALTPVAVYPALQRGTGAQDSVGLGNGRSFRRSSTVAGGGLGMMDGGAGAGGRTTGRKSIAMMNAERRELINRQARAEKRGLLLRTETGISNVSGLGLDLDGAGG